MDDDQTAPSSAVPKHDAIERPPPATPGETGRIWSGEHSAWWRPNSEGYTVHVEAAGVYSRAEFGRITSHCGPEKRLRFEPIPAQLMEVK